MFKQNQKATTFISLLTLVTFLSWNGSLVDSTTSTKRPDVNFYGSIEDHYKTFAAEDILIGGKYEVIPVYQGVNKKKKDEGDKEKSQDVDPKQNKALLDLKEVKSIELKHPEHPTASQITINNRDYSEIVVISINNSKKNYLIESSRKITCREVDKGPQGDHKAVHEERELNIIHLKKLVIKGYKSTRDEPIDREYQKAAKQERPSMSEQKAQVTKDTGDILEKIEQGVKSLSHQDPSAFEKMKASLLSMLKSLREQLQKMLNMLQ